MNTSIIFPADIPNPAYPLKITRENNVIRSSSDAGYTITRRKYTKTRKTYELKWTALKSSLRNMLIDFYDSKTQSGALSFIWKYPVTNEEIEVRFTQPPEESLTAPNLYSISCSVMEV